MYNGLKQYQNIDLESQVLSASPHKLIQMLLDGCLQRISIAKIHIQNGNIPEKIKMITKAIDIVVALRCNLADIDNNEVSKQLFSLYEFVENHLIFANLKNSIEKLDEAYHIINTIKSGWDAIAEQQLEQVATNE